MWLISKQTNVQYTFFVVFNELPLIPKVFLSNFCVYFSEFRTQNTAIVNNKHFMFIVKDCNSSGVTVSVMCVYFGARAMSWFADNSIDVGFFNILSFFFHITLNIYRAREKSRCNFLLVHIIWLLVNVSVYMCVFSSRSATKLSTFTQRQARVYVYNCLLNQMDLWSQAHDAYFVYFDSAIYFSLLRFNLFFRLLTSLSYKHIKKQPKQHCFYEEATTTIRYMHIDRYTLSIIILNVVDIHCFCVPLNFCVTINGLNVIFCANLFTGIGCKCTCQN